MNHSQHNNHSHHEHMIEDFKKRFWICLILTIPIIILSPMIQMFAGMSHSMQFKGNMYILFVLSSIVFFYGGWPFLKGLFDELKGGKPGMMTLIAVAITVAYVYSCAIVFGLSGSDFFWELATLIDIMLLGHWIEMKSVMGASKSLEELVKLMPSEAHKISDDGSIMEVKVETLQIGDKILIKPGEKIPADGIVIKGESFVNESMLTGESNPVDKKIGSDVIGGSINGDGSLTVEVKKKGDQSFLSQVIELVKQAQESKSKTQDLANRAALWLTIVALGSGIITFIVWEFILKRNFDFSLERTVTVMVITCPHALGLAIPLVVAVSTALAAGHGLLIRNRAAFEQARNLQAVIFDKTGTLTEGKFGITDVITFTTEVNKDELLKLAASLENNSEHPIAKGIATSVKNFYSIENFKAIPGKGAEGIIDGKDIKVVSPGYLKEKNIAIESSNESLNKIYSEGKTVVFVLFDNKLTGAIALADIIRPESKETITSLKAMGIKCMMLTGDNNQVAKAVSQEIGLDEYFAEVLPDKKADKVKEVQSRGLIVAMVGDGVNDAPALAQANVGIAIGAGTDVAIETADIILVRSNPLDVVSLISLARLTYKKMVQNLLWATGYNTFAIPLAAGVLFSYGILLSPAVGAILMSLSTVIVAINARLLKIKK